MKKMRFLLGAVALALLFSVGCRSSSTGADPAPSPVADASTPTRPSPTSSEVPSGLPSISARDAAHMIGLVIILEIPDAKVERYRYSMGEDSFDVVGYRGLRATFEFGDEKKVQVIPNRQFAAFLTMKKPRSAYTRVDRITFELPGYEPLVLKNVQIVGGYIRFPLQSRKVQGLPVPVSTLPMRKKS